MLSTSSPERRKSSAEMFEVGKLGDAEVLKCECGEEKLLGAMKSVHGEEKLVGAGVMSEMGRFVAVDVFSVAAEVAGADVEGAELVCAGVGK